MFLTVEGFDHTHCIEVFLDHIVQLVIGPENLIEQRINLSYYYKHAQTQHRQNCQKYQRQSVVYAESSDKSKEQHSRRTHGNPYYHLESLLHVGNVCGKTGNYAAGGKFIYIGKGKLLHLVIHGLSQVFCKAG